MRVYRSEPPALPEIPLSFAPVSPCESHEIAKAGMGVCGEKKTMVVFVTSVPPPTLFSFRCNKTITRSRGGAAAFQKLHVALKREGRKACDGGVEAAWHCRAWGSFGFFGWRWLSFRGLGSVGLDGLLSPMATNKIMALTMFPVDDGAWLYLLSIFHRLFLDVFAWLAAVAAVRCFGTRGNLWAKGWIGNGKR